MKPVAFRWDGDAMVPMPAWVPRCNEQFVVGERYSLIPFEDRGDQNHNHLMVMVDGYFRNWPESYELLFESRDQLRKHALIRTGHYNQHICAFATGEDVARYIKDVTDREEYAEFSQNDTVLVVRYAKTQKRKAMGRELFNKSKQDIFDFFAAVTGIPVEVMERETEAQRQRRKKGMAA